MEITPEMMLPKKQPKRWAVQNPSLVPQENIPSGEPDLVSLLPAQEFLFQEQ